jgi:hypothetical protein
MTDDARGHPRPGQPPTSGSSTPPLASRSSHPTSLVSEALHDAASVALEALEERIRFSRLMLDDSAMYGLADARRLQRSVSRDEEAVRVLSSALGQPVPFGR